MINKNLVISKICKSLPIISIFYLMASISASAINYSYEKPSHVLAGSLNEKEISTSPEQLILESKEISKDEYSLISRSDDERLYSVSDPAAEGYPCILYEFKIRYKGNATLIWEGYSDQPFIENVSIYVNLYLWNYSKNGWDLIINCTSFNVTNHNITDRTLLFNFSTISPYYVKNDYIYLLAVGPYGAGYSGGILATDYVAIKHEIKAKTPSPIYIVILAMLFIILFKMRKTIVHE